jgi:hypothetical protein
MERALKYTLATLLSIVLLLLAIVYGLYYSGARDVPANFRATTERYPEAARLALWRSYGGQGAPTGNPLSPPEFAWRWYQARDALMDRRQVDPAMRLAGQVGRRAQPVEFHGSMMQYQLIGVAGAIRASHWPIEGQLDTVLDTLSFGVETPGLHAGAERIYGRPPEALHAAELDILIVVAKAPAYYDPWCHPQRIRRHVLSLASREELPGLPQRLDAALAAVGPRPAEHRCVGNPG